MSGHAQAAVPSQLPYKIGRQRSVSQTLHQELPKSTSPPTTLITRTTQLTADSRGNRNQPSCLRTGWSQTTYALTRSARAPTRHVLQLYTSWCPADKTCATKK
ncbi:hypothetical protein FHG87_018821 [Trinorchestia longiramus]|nr:hypothetical protein FHG87_018821 [Trinorchestia longiramus]